jgi:hypothetical protein
MFTLNSATLRSASNISPYEAYLGDFIVSKQSNGTVLVKWTTISEHNNEYFSVERSADGVHYTDIGKIVSLGNTSYGFSYQFIDSKPCIGKNFYRLRMVSVALRNKYSDIKYVQVSNNKPVMFSVFPNPAANSVLLQINAKDDEKIKVEIYDATGNKALIKTCIIKHQKTELDIRSLKTGAYAIVAVTPIGMQYTSKLIVMK